MSEAAITDTFKLEDGRTTKELVRALGIALPINRGWNAEYAIRGGRVYCMRGNKNYQETLVFRFAVHPILGGAPRGFWDRV